jgi:hypothetical protein
MKYVMAVVLGIFLSPNSAFGDSNIRTYFIMNQEKTDSKQKFDKMISLCGGKIVKQIGNNAVIAEMSIHQGMCVAENTRKIIIQITHRN